jgi:tetratricopeptide (TPR) repeat protein
MIDWIINNYQWFFSGLGVFLLTSIVLFIKRQQTKRSTIRNIRIGDETQVSIIQLEGNVQISHSNLKDINSDQILAESLEEKRAEMLKLKTKLVKEKEMYDPEKRMAMEYNNRAAQLEKEGKYNEALIKIRKTINLDPEEELYKENLVAITENYAYSLALDSHLFDETITLMEKIQGDGLLSNADGYWILGYAYYRKKLYEQAISAYQQAIIHEPKYYIHHLYLAEAYFEKGIKDNDLNHQERALKEVELSLRLKPQQIKNDDIRPSFAEIVLLRSLIEINKGNLGQIKTDYENFLLRIGCYSSNQIDELTEAGQLALTVVALIIQRAKSTAEEKIDGRVDLDTIMHGVKTIEEIQAMVKDATKKEIPIPALSTLLRITQVNQGEKMELVTDLVRSLGEEETMVFAKELDKILKTRKRWLIIEKGDESVFNVA